MKLSSTKGVRIGTLGCGWITNVNTHEKAYELAVKLQPLKFEYFGNWDASNPNFIPNDGHFSETGHRNFSKITLEFLVKSLDNLE